MDTSRESQSLKVFCRLLKNLKQLRLQPHELRAKRAQRLIRRPLTWRCDVRISKYVLLGCVSAINSSSSAWMKLIVVWKSIRLPAQKQAFVVSVLRRRSSRLHVWVTWSRVIAVQLNHVLLSCMRCAVAKVMKCARSQHVWTSPVVVVPKQSSNSKLFVSVDVVLMLKKLKLVCVLKPLSS